MENKADTQFLAFIKEMLHPVRSNVFIEVYARGEATAGELAAALQDIPQATLYRHLGAMVDQGILKIVAQRKKRALHENVYAIGVDFNANLSEMLEQNRGDVYAAMFYQYMMVFFKEFQAYATRPGIDIANDGSGFTMSPVCVTTEELMQLLGQIGALLEPLRANTLAPGTGRHMHTIGLIITPPQETE